MPRSCYAFRRGLLCSTRPQPGLEVGDAASDFGPARRCCLRTCCTRRLTTFCGPENTSLCSTTAGRGREGLCKENQALNVSYDTDSLYQGDRYSARTMYAGE